MGAPTVLSGPRRLTGPYSRQPTFGVDAPAVAPTFTVATSTHSRAFARPANDKVVALHDGSLAVALYDGTNGKVYHVTNPTASPTSTGVATFAEDNLSMCVLNNGTTTDLWIAGTCDITPSNTIHVQHGVWDGATWTWDAQTLVGNGLVSATEDCSIAWNGTYLILMWWDGIGSSSSDQIRYTYTNIKAGTSGWVAQATFDQAGASTTVWQVNLKHSAKLGATVVVMGGNSRIFYSTLLDSLSPARANWHADTVVDLFDDTLTQFGGPQVVVDEATGTVHLARAVCNAGGPTWSGTTYWKGTPDATPMVTGAITFGTRVIVDAASTVSSPSDVGVCLDAGGTVWEFWTDALTAGNLKYSKLVSPYTSGTTGTTYVATGSPRYPHLPSTAVSGYLPLVYQTGTTSPFSVVLDTGLVAPSGSPSGTGSLTLSGSAATVAPSAAGSLTLGGSATAVSAATGSLTLAASGTWTEPAAAALTLTATGTASAAPVATGTLSITGTAAWTEPAAGAVTLTGSATPAAAATASAAVTLSGTATVTPSGTNAAGSIALAAAGTGRAAATTADALSLTGAATASGSTAATAVLTLIGQLAARANASALATLTLSGAATATGAAVTSAVGYSRAVAVIAQPSAASFHTIGSSSGGAS